MHSNSSAKTKPAQAGRRILYLQTGMDFYRYMIAAKSAALLPLWVKSRHRDISNQCPLCPRKQTSEPARINFDAIAPAAWRYSPQSAAPHLYAVFLGQILLNLVIFWGAGYEDTCASREGTCDSHMPHRAPVAHPMFVLRSTGWRSFAGPRLAGKFYQSA